MLSYFDLRRGVQFVLDDKPYEVLEFRQMGKSQDVVVAQTKIRNLTNGQVLVRNFHQGDMFKEAEIVKKPAKFIYAHRGKFVFCEASNPSKRFELSGETLGDAQKFLQSNIDVSLLIFREQVINVSLPVKVSLKVTDAPPNIKGDTAQGGNKPCVLETGAIVNTPLFIESGDIIEVNTETGEYVRRVEKTK